MSENKSLDSSAPDEIDSSPDVDEQRLTEAMRLIDDGVPLPGDEFREELKASSQRKFESAATAPEAQPVAAPMATQHDRSPGARGWIPSVTAAVALIGMTVWLFQTSVNAAPLFGQVLQNVREAESLKLSVTMSGQSHEVYVRGKDSLRWVDSEDRYQIVKDKQVWRINERTKRFTTDASALFEDGAVNLIELLGVAVDSKIAREMAFDEDESRDRAEFVYYISGKRGSQDVRLQAFVGKSNNQLQKLLVWSTADDSEKSPICELVVEAWEPPLDDDLFIVAKHLTEDFRIGRIVDAEGIVTVKPVMHERWTPVSREMVLKRGDWIRTDNRGPNAVAVRVNNATLTVGPGSMVELIDKNQARVHYGEVKVHADKKKAFQLIAGKADTLKVEGKKLLRLVGDAFKVLTHTPMWLAGFEGTQSDESMGSLIANLDGRDVALAVGYHKVSVEIRDQIARTTIEESFVNHTNGRLEGQFYFPLPQDASISGFGMWIGNELVEADVVEKQRAREIYETILREKRDPALLEWTGGNIFKARVFPIFPHSEKRIKITYTQVLPLRGNTYRYSYGLKSELLKQTPLRELSIDLKVYSERKLRQIDCPSHVARIDQTEHAGHIEFSAQQYSPDRDFEAVIEVDGHGDDVVVIPHQRGDDGYFMLQLTPPGADGNWQRDLLEDGEPLKLLILADTSASMDNDHRKTQDEFIASLLMSLGPKDRFNLAACDVECDWAFDEMQSPRGIAFQPVDEAVADAKEATGWKPIPRAREFLANRVSLGWTDLDRAFESVLERADEHTHVIYIGDGIVTAGSADPDEFVNRFNRLVDDTKATFHAVTVGNSYESVVLKAIASVGGGSFRQVNAEQGSQTIAKELLSEITTPGLTDLNVEIRGIRIARMYPEELPNIAAGKQHIIIGRYLPEGHDQRGEVVVTGKRDDQTVKFRSRFTLVDAEKGNSFIPRLWARLHLDRLLSLGRSDIIKDEIISLSEEYHIMTPYTSLLVLESDADRQRFKVKRRFLMRDGEKFFADGRKNANYELKQKQMKLAGLWRQNLWTRILKNFTGMGRDLSMLNPWAMAQRLQRDNNGYGKNSGFGDYGLSFDNQRASRRLSEQMQKLTEEARESWDDPASSESPDEGEFERDEKAADSPDDSSLDAQELPPASTPAPVIPPRQQMEAEWAGGGDYGKDIAWKEVGYGKRGNYGTTQPGFGNMLEFRGFGYGLRGDSERRSQDEMIRYTPSEWMIGQFPKVGPPNTPREPNESTWPEEAIALSNSLLRLESLKTIHGLEVTQEVTGFDPYWDRISSKNNHMWLWSKDRWTNQATTPGSDTNVFFCDAETRGVYSKARLLGTTRKSDANDVAIPNIPGTGHCLVPMHEVYAYMTATVEDAGENRKRLMVTHPQRQFRYLIDTQRNVILEIDDVSDGKVRQRTVFSDFKDIAGQAWATNEVIYRAHNNGWPGLERGSDPGHLKLGGVPSYKTSETRRTIRVLGKAEFAKQFDTVLASKPNVLYLITPLPTPADARETRTNGRAVFEEHIVLADYFQHSGQWDRVAEHLEAMETLAENKAGIWHLRNRYLQQMDRETLRQRLLARAKTLADKPSPTDYFEASQIVGLATQITAYNEQLEVLDVLKPVYDRQPDHAGAKQSWQESRIAVLFGLGRTDLAIELRKQMAEANPWNVYAQIQYASSLTNSRQDFDSAFAWLKKTLAVDKWTTEQREQLRQTLADYQEGQGRYAELLETTTAWIEENPESNNAPARHLTALIWNDKIEEAEVMMLDWIKAGVTEFTDEEFDQIDSFQPTLDKAMTHAVSLRMNAALSVAMGQGYNLYTYRIDPQWMKPLSRVVLTFARQTTNRSFSDRVLSHSHFHNTDEANAIRAAAFELLNKELATLPFHELQTFLRWSLASTARIEKEQWESISDRLITRWQECEAADEKHQIGSQVVSVMSSRLDMERRLEFMRRQINEGPADYQLSYISTLFELMFQQAKWEQRFEDEAFSLLPRLSDAKDGTRMTTILPALHRLTNAMISQRYQTALKDVDHETKANRIAYAKKKYELYQAARIGSMRQIEKQMETAEDWLKDWMKIEHVYLSIKAGEKLKDQCVAVREFLGNAPPAPKPDAKLNDAKPAKLDDNPNRSISSEGLRQLEKLKQKLELLAKQEAVREYLDGALRHRYVMTAAHLATRRATTKFIADHLLKYVDAGIAKNPVAEFVRIQKDADTAELSRVQLQAKRIAAAKNARNLSWKSAKYELLIALDRPRELERDLTAWIKNDRQTAPWRLSLGRLLAEQGRLDEAIRLYKAVEHADELRPAEYKSLADWHMALDQRDEYEAARVSYYKVMGESQISQRLSQELRKYQATDGSAPATLDREILMMIQALMEKSESPANHLHHIRHYYDQTKDFRLLRHVPIGGLGNTAGHLYSYVSNCSYAFLGVLEEAAIDEVVELLDQARAEAKTDIDRRLLDLIEVVAERRAITLQNQAGPHVDRALAALKRAFDHEWADGESLMMSSFLHSLGRMPQDVMRDEQLRQMKQLHVWAKQGSHERLNLANNYANSLWGYDEHDKAFVELEAAINEFDAANDRKWPAVANNVLENYFSKLTSKRRYADAEAVLLDHSSRPRMPTQLDHFQNRLDQLYYDCLVNNGRVTLGEGQTLYDNYLARLQRRLDGLRDQPAYQHIEKIVQLFSAVNHSKKFVGVDEEFRKFAYERTPQELKRATQNYRAILNTVSNTYHLFFGAEPAIRYLLDRIDEEPPRFKYRNDDAWNHHAGTIAGWLHHIIHREQREPAEDLQARMLKMALAELDRDLNSRQQRGRYFYGHNYGYYWTVKQPAFIKAAEAIYKKLKDSSEAVAYIAAYLYQISQQNRAIEMLFEVHRAGRLNDSHIQTLVGYLQGQNRYPATIPLLEGLVERHPDRLAHRTSLMYSYFVSERPNQLTELLKATHDHFHKDNRWTLNVMGTLAGACRQCKLWEPAAEYYRNAVIEHRRTQPNQINDDMLSSYYQGLANCYYQLDKVNEAVDAASSAIVCWSTSNASRNGAIYTLQNIFVHADYADRYIVHLDKEVERTQQERPIIRKALGQAYQQKGEYAKAAKQLQLAINVQPNDAATHESLIQCYDHLKDQDAAIKASLAFLQLDRRNVDTYATLGDRMKADKRQQERALTAMVEMKPNEADSHTKLAEIRESQGRWPDAIDHWKHVVRIRSLEPTGLYRLIDAQIQAKRIDDARSNIKKLEQTKWPARFGTQTNRVEQYRRRLRESAERELE